MSTTKHKAAAQRFPRAIPFSTIPVLLVLLVSALAIVWFIQFETRAFYQTQKNLAINSVRGVEYNLSQMIRHKHERVLSLVEQERALLLDIAEFPADQDNLEQLELLVKNRFPDYFNYLIADNAGNPLLKEKVLKIGPQYRHSIHEFAKSSGLQNEKTIIHNADSATGHFHYDIIAKIDKSTHAPVFLVSFNAQEIIQLLLNSQMPDQSLVLVNRDNPAHVEISAKGVNQGLSQVNKISAIELESVLHEKAVTGTNWNLLAIPRANIFSDYRQSLIIRTVSAFCILLAIVAVLQWRLLNEEKSRRQAEIKLQHSLDELEERVERRTLELKESEQNVQNSFMSAPYGMLIVNKQGVIESANHQVKNIFFYDIDELVGMLIEQLIPEPLRNQHEQQRQLFSSHPSGRLMGNGRKLKALKKNGEIFDVEVGLNQLKHSGENKVIASISDISELARVHNQLMEEHERAVVTLRSIGDGVITTDVSGIVNSMNQVAEKLSGWQEVDAIGQHITDVYRVLNEKTREKVDDPVIQCLHKQMIVELGTETVLLHKKGMDIPIEDSAAPIHDSEGSIIGAVLVFHDVSQTRAHTHAIEYQANHDALTGILNRREFDRRLSQAVAQADTKGTEYILLFLDLDRFKLVNDNAGHAAGDELLKELTRLLSSKLRQRDTFARLGGDEFGVLLGHCSKDIGIKLASKLRSVVDDFRFFWNEQVYRVGVSIGMVSFDSGKDSSDELLSAADAACYTAKENGRNRIHVYDADAARKRSESSIVNMLSDAYENNRMQLYQQQIKATAKDHKMLHYELLIRMLSEDGEILSPGMFLPAAERYGLATNLDRWVIRATFDWLKTHQAALTSPVMFAINLSGQSLTDEPFREFVIEQFSQQAFEKHRICFEITETAAMNNLEKVKLFMHELSEVGCRFSLDDFGSGHASYAHLKHLPVDYLKIDGLFVKDICQDPIDFSIVKSVNEVGHVLGMKTIAEFVENQDIIDKLEEIGVDYLQGYGISRPAPLDNLLL